MCWWCGQELSHEMIKRSPNVLIVGPGRGLGSSHNAIWWNLAIFSYVQPEDRPSNRWLDESLAKSLGVVVVMAMVIVLVVVVVMVVMMVLVVW